MTCAMYDLHARTIIQPAKYVNRLAGLVLMLQHDDPQPHLIWCEGWVCHNAPQLPPDALRDVVFVV
jgi:hypothetical protein